MERGRRTTYHHGNLRQALIDAAVELVREQGVEAMTLREAARRAEVSSGAPFRHFADKRELVLALAEEGMGRLRQAIEAALDAGAAFGAPARLALLGSAYVGWAADNPTHYRVLGDRLAIDFYHSEALLADNRWIRETMEQLLEEGRAGGQLKLADPAQVNLQLRALAYGLARMMVDGHFPEFRIAPEEVRATMIAALDGFLIGLARDPVALRAEFAAARQAASTT